MFARSGKGSHAEHLVCDPVSIVVSEQPRDITGGVFHLRLNLWCKGALQHPRAIGVKVQSTVSCLF